MIIDAQKNTKKPADLLIHPLFSDFDLPDASSTLFSPALFERLKHAQKFEAKPGQVLLLPLLENTGSYIAFLGLGPKETLHTETLRIASGALFSAMKNIGAINARFDISPIVSTSLSAFMVAKSVSEGLLFASYAFAEYKIAHSAALERITICSHDGKIVAQAKKGITEAQMLNAGVSLARELVNKPGNEMTPSDLANAAKLVSKKSKGVVKVRVFDEAWAKKQGMEAYLAVAQGSMEQPQFIHLHYKPSKPTKKSVAIVGKGVTFDSGGLSLKPAQFMETMKCDMAGAAAVIGFFSLLSELKPRMEIHGIIAATENMPGHASIRPGDIVRAANGKTIEILNTDAEGRLTLADAFFFAGKQKPDILIDLATLTGACVMALGDSIAGLMGNDDELLALVKKSADEAGEPVWTLPLYAPYADRVKSDIADMRNTSKVPMGGTITAGLFLQEFVPDGVKWAHVDIAGPAFAERPLSSYLHSGATGFGIRTLVELIRHL